MKRYDFSNELLPQQYQNGVKLVRPTSENYDFRKSLKDLYDLRINVYFTDSNAVMRGFNDEQAITFGYSKLTLVDQSLYNFMKFNSAENIEKNNKQVMQNKNLFILEEDVVKIDDIQNQALSIKMPWYNADNQIVGIFGFGIILGIHPLAESLAKIADMGFLNIQKTPMPGLEVYNQYLTHREKQILEFTLKGYSAKQIAKALDLSHRTVESYLINIKTKLKVTSRMELIEMFN